ncbi:MAG: hypothetical protein IPL41_08425 [Micropruina sp.]|nr:hypothetical protein [Micropruina sp.]
MTELENRLRADLSHAASEVNDDLDVAALLDRGHERTRARTQRRTVGAVAAAVAVGLVAWTGFLPRTQNGVPDPAQTPSVSVGTTASATIDLSGMEPEPAYRSITVAVENGVGTFTGKKGGWAGPSATPGDTLATVRLGGETVRAQRVDERLTVGLVADRVEWLEASLEQDPGAWSTPFEVVDGMNVTAFVLYTEADSDSPLANLTWRSLDGSVRSSGGEQVSTATLGLTNDTYTVYYVPGIEHVGYYSTLGGKGQFSSEMRKDSSVVKIDASSTRLKNAVEHIAVGVLPPGASDPNVTFNMPGAELAVGPLQQDGRVAFFARMETTKEWSSTLVKAVTYTAADGRKVSYRNE